MYFVVIMIFSVLVSCDFLPYFVFGQLTKLNSDKADKTTVHNLRGQNANLPNSSLLQWASDDARRLSIWKIEGNSITGFPDDGVEWCALNLQDGTGTRGIVVAFKYFASGLTVKYRCYVNKEWLSNWMTIV